MDDGLVERLQTFERVGLVFGVLAEVIEQPRMGLAKRLWLPLAELRREERADDWMGVERGVSFQPIVFGTLIAVKRLWQFTKRVGWQKPALGAADLLERTENRRVGGVNRRGQRILSLRSARRKLSEVGLQLVERGPAQEVKTEHLVGPLGRLLARQRHDHDASDDRHVHLNRRA